MEQIAMLAGVSIGTVSRVVNKKDKVHQKTRARIEALIDQVGYQPCVAAQNLASRKTNNIMLIVPRITDMYYPKIVHGICYLCRDHGKRMWLGVSDADPEIEAQYLEQAHEGAVDGLIISSLQAESNVRYFMELAQRSFPVINLDVESLTLKMHTVKYDDMSGAMEAVRHLLDRGHRRICFCASTQNLQTVRDRLLGYQQALMENGIPIDNKLILNTETGLEAWPWSKLSDLLNSSERPTALFAENDAMAIACIQFLYRRGLRVPDDVAVVGFGNAYDVHAIDKRLTTVGLPLEQACRTAVEMLLSQIEKLPEERTPPEIKILKPHLVIGETT
jgi:DNA-binding LacI/PurR family transcriptional regulator